VTTAITPAAQPMPETRLNELAALAGTPAEVTTGAHAAAQSALASSVPELLAEIGLLRSLIHDAYQADMAARLEARPHRRTLRAALAAYDGVPAAEPERTRERTRAATILADAVRGYLEGPA
jgi:hypothetical protein